VYFLGLDCSLLNAGGPPLPPNLIEAALAGDKFSIAKLVSIFESIRPADQQTCLEIDNTLLTGKEIKQGLIIGLTGAPGAGKSTLIQHLVEAVLEIKPDWRIAVVAVDPSSTISGGALLGDRTRVNFGNDARTYFRSQASDLDLGGVGRNTFRVCRLLRRLFDVVLVESVGVGQSEIEIGRLADVTLLALQPFSGDQIQFMKSGIMEIPQAFVITKCDAEDLAQRSLYQLESSLDFIQHVDASTLRPRIFQTSSVRKTGFSELAEFVSSTKPLAFSADSLRAEYFLQKEVRQLFGEYGLRGLPYAITNEPGVGYEQRRLEIIESLKKQLPAAWRGSESR
jgi:LAO/AO transport system kinase